MAINSVKAAETRSVMAKLLPRKVVKNQSNTLTQLPDEFVSQGQEVLNNGNTKRVSFSEIRSFLKRLFKAKKTKEKYGPFIQISDKFTPHERALILGNNKKVLKDIREMISVKKTPFVADLVENSDKSVRQAVFHIGSKTIYIDMNRASDEEISTLVNNLIYYPFGF